MLYSKQSKAAEGILELNRTRLKKVFNKLIPDKDGRVPFSELVKFAKLTKIFPVSSIQDLVSMAELKKIAGKFGSSSKISFSQFEQTLRLIAVGFFTDSGSADRVKQLIKHIKNPCKAIFGVTLLVQFEETPDLSLKSSLARPKSVAELLHRREDSSMKIDTDILAALEVLKSPRSCAIRTPSGLSGRASPSEGFLSHRTAGTKKPLSLKEDSISTRRILSQPPTTRSESRSFQIDIKSLKLLEEKVELSDFIETERTIKDEVKFVRSARRAVTRPPAVPLLSLHSFSRNENRGPKKLQTPKSQHTKTEALLSQVISTFEAFKSKHLSLVKRPSPSKITASKIPGFDCRKP